MVDGNGTLHRLFVMILLVILLALGIVHHAYVVAANRGVNEILTSQEATKRTLALNGVVATLPPAEAIKLFDLMLKQVDPTLQPEIRRRVLIPGVPEVSGKSYAK